MLLGRIHSVFFWMGGQSHQMRDFWLGGKAVRAFINEQVIQCDFLNSTENSLNGGSDGALTATRHGDRWYMKKTSTSNSLLDRI